MKRAIFLIALLCAVHCFGQSGNISFTGNIAISGNVGGVATSGGSVSYFLQQDFESAGTPSGWTSSGTVTFHNTSSPLEGTGDLLVGAGSSSYAVTPQFGPYTEMWLFCKFNITTVPTSAAHMLGIVDYATGGTFLANFDLDNLGGGRLSFYVGGSQVGGFFTGITTATTYYAWMHYKTGTGNAVVSGGISTDGTEPTSGATFAGTTTGTITTTAGYSVFEEQNAGVIHFDHVRCSTTDPGSNPP